MEERSEAIRLGRHGIRCPLVLERLEWDETSAMGYLIRSQLFQIQPVDPLSHGSALMLLTATAFLASLIPALRAAKTEPSEALRDQ